MALSDHSVTPVRNTSVRQACTVVGGVENLALLHPIVLLTGLPWWLSGKESACQCRKPGFDLWVWKITVGKEMATPVFLPGKSHGQRSLKGYSPWGCKRVRHYLSTKQQQQKYFLLRDSGRNCPLVSAAFILNIL